MVAKAPRKNLAAVRSPSSCSSNKRKGKAGGGGGNALKLWPVPKGQKGLQSFLGGGVIPNRQEEAGCSSSSVDTGEGTSAAIMDNTIEETATNQSPSCSPSRSPSPSPSEEDSTPHQQLSFLEDITQINSDSDD